MNNKHKTSQSRWPSFGLRAAPARPLPPPVPPLSSFSTTGVRDSVWCSLDMMLGAGMIIIQENTHKIVVVYETKKEYWFFPRGRKDVGESLETAALREGYEESGYRAQFMPLFNPTRQPHSPEDTDGDLKPNTEPIAVTLTSWKPKTTRQGEPYDSGGEYLTTWYVGRIPEDAVKDTGTGMWDEQHYESHLLSFEEAVQRVWGQELMILRYAWTIYGNTLEKQQVQAAVSVEGEQ
ncbi:hypothetical protein BDN70DRAFT_798276 [Pholiota conissans]|uniref:Nudix hydrolase domain-containing protein n=1 Tax=Pholiota conissans TaxID=109636 RepID=A0A9P6D548_9AGAR|nr:hypothetical protein BDN70DRAFT_798276 [Pholiota conissans]